MVEHPSTVQHPSTMEEKKSVDLSVNLSGLTLENPVIPASGCFGFGYELTDVFDPEILGSIALKGTTPEARYGNPTPRIADCPSGMLNAVGLQNPGVDRVLAEEIPKLKGVYSKKVIANICGFSVEDYVRVATAFDQEEAVGILEINVSCPNVKHGGMSFGLDPKAASEVTRAVRSETTKPVYVKLSPNVTSILAIAEACLDAGADGLTAINTLVGMRMDLKKRQPLLKNRTGGLSGPAIFPIALRMVYELYQAFRVPILGVGGISSAADALEMIAAGASAIQIGACGLVDPWTWPRVIEDLPAAMKKLGIKRLGDWIGAGQLEEGPAAKESSLARHN